MTPNEIRSAIEKGKTVYWSNKKNKVVVNGKGNLAQYMVSDDNGKTGIALFGAKGDKFGGSYGDDTSLFFVESCNKNEEYLTLSKDYIIEGEVVKSGTQIKVDEGFNDMPMSLGQWKSMVTSNNVSSITIRVNDGELISEINRVNSIEIDNRSIEINKGELLVMLGLGDFVGSRNGSYYAYNGSNYSIMFHV